MESTLRRTWAEIDLDALAHNYQTLRRRTGTRFVGVVKADAYGHGSVQVSRVLEELGADYLAVSSLDEAMELRAGGIHMPILILGHTPPERVEELVLYRWNRDYPADVYLDWDLSRFQVSGLREFPGTSHPNITRTIYVRKERNL